MVEHLSAARPSTTHFMGDNITFHSLDLAVRNAGVQRQGVMVAKPPDGLPTCLGAGGGQRVCWSWKARSSAGGDRDLRHDIPACYPAYVLHYISVRARIDDHVGLSSVRHNNEEFRLLGHRVRPTSSSKNREIPPLDEDSMTNEDRGLSGRGFRQRSTWSAPSKPTTRS